MTICFPANGVGTTYVYDPAGPEIGVGVTGTYMKNEGAGTCPLVYYQNLYHLALRIVQLHKEGFGSISIARRKSDSFFEEAIRR